MGKSLCFQKTEYFTERLFIVIALGVYKCLKTQEVSFSAVKAPCTNTLLIVCLILV